MVAQNTISGSLNVKALDAVKGIGLKGTTFPVLNRTALVDAGRTVVAVTNLTSIAYLPMTGEAIEPVGDWEAISLTECKRQAWSYCFGAGDCPMLPRVPAASDVVMELSPADCAALARVAAAAATDPDNARPALRFVSLAPGRGGSVEVAATDGFRLHRTTIGTSVAERYYLIPADVCLALGKLQCWARVSAYVDGATARYPGSPRIMIDCLSTSRGGRVATIITVAADETYPNYMMLIPRDPERPSRMDTAGEIADLCAYIRQDREAQMRLPSCTKGADHPDFHYPVTVDGVTRYAQIAYMAAAVAGLPKSAPVRLSIHHEPLAPILVSADEQGWQAVIMPIVPRDGGR